MASRVEQCIAEKEQRKSNQVGPKGPYLILVIDYDLVEEDAREDQLNVQADIMVAEFIQGKPYIYLALTPSKGKEVAKRKRKFICLIFPRLIRLLIAC